MKNSKYNLRQDECKAAAYALMGYAGLDYGTFAEARLRDVPYEVFMAYKIVYRSCGADVRNIFTVNLPGRRKAHSCGAKETWKAMDSWYLKADNLRYTVMSAGAMN